MENVKKLEGIFKGLANRRRLAIVRILSKEKRLPVGEIARRIKLSLPSTSKHLILLKRIDIVDSRQENLTVYYSLSDPLPEIVQKVLQIVSNFRQRWTSAPARRSF